MNVCSSVLSHHNKDLEWWTLNPRCATALGSWTDRVIALRSRTGCIIALRQISVTTLCYRSILFRKYQENPSSGREDMSTQRGEEKSAPARGGERDLSPFGSSFYMFFPPLGLSYVNWASQECCLFYLRSSLQSSDLPLFYFCGLLSSLSFSHHHSRILFPILTT